MLAQIDAICEETGVWPHAVLSGHAHNYQRFTRHAPTTPKFRTSLRQRWPRTWQTARKADSPLRRPQTIEVPRRHRQW